MNSKIKTEAVEYNKLGFAYFNKGKTDSAINNFQKAIEIAPEYSVAYYRLGIANNANGDSDKAISCFKKAASLGHQNAQKYCRDNKII